MTQNELMAQIAKLEAENAALRKSKQGKLTLKVSKAGAVSVYGLGRWPVTLYKEQMLRLMGEKDQIVAFIEAHDSELKAKGDAPATPLSEAVEALVSRTA